MSIDQSRLPSIKKAYPPPPADQEPKVLVLYDGHGDDVEDYKSIFRNGPIYYEHALDQQRKFRAITGALAVLLGTLL